MARTTASNPLAIDEVGFAALTAVIALVCLIIAAKAIDPVMGFHAWLGVAMAALGTFMIFRSHNARSGPIPQEIDGKPNYQYGPIKFASIAALFWGIAGFTGRPDHRLAAGLSSAEL
jgi:cytochrome c oxidase cbb3-type subunit 1